MEKVEDDKKKAEDGKNGPPTASEMLLQERARDPDEAVIAEQAIRHFVTNRLHDFYEEIEGAIDSLEAWVHSQDEASRTSFAQNGFFYSLGDRFESELYGIAGGKGTPIMDAIVGEVHNTVAWAEHAESDLYQFVNYLRRSVRDACWFMRDNVMAVCSNQWPQLLDLAYEGSFDFVPLMYTLGMPTRSFQPQQFGDRLIGHADAYRRAVVPEKQHALDQAQSSEKKAEIEEDAQKLAMDDEAKKQQQALTQAM